MQRLQGWVRYAAEGLTQKAGAQQQQQVDSCDEEDFIYARVHVQSDDEDAGDCSRLIIYTAAMVRCSTELLSRCQLAPESTASKESAGGNPQSTVIPISSWDCCICSVRRMCMTAHYAAGNHKQLHGFSQLHHCLNNPGFCCCHKLTQ